MMQSSTKKILSLISNMNTQKWTIAFCTYLLTTLLFWTLLPLPHFTTPLSIVLMDQNNQLLGASIATDEQWRFPEMDTIPQKFIDAITRYEDKRFFKHRGVDPIAVARAVRDNVRHRRIASGASTLTMQVIRLSRGRRRTIFEKIMEMILALRLELTHCKSDILKLYASHAPFGGNVVGLEAAAWRYFARPPDRLSWAEMAMLAVLPNSPSLIHPGRNRNLLMDKRNRLLHQLLQHGNIDSLTCILACQEPLPQKPHPLPMDAPHLLEQLKQTVAVNHRKKPNQIHRTRFHTTLKASIQKSSTEIVNRHTRHLSQNGIHNAAALILDIESNSVLAYVGNATDSSGGGHGQYVDIISAQRSTGSILKPILYAAMNQSGEILPTTLVPDIPTRMGGFAPQNYDRTFEGAVPAYRALARSLNVPAVRMLHSYGVDRFHRLLSSLGMTTLHRPARDYGLSLILGGAEGTLWDMTAIYAGMARTVNHFFMDKEVDIPFSSPHLNRHPKLDKAEALSPINHNVNLDAGSCWLTIQAMLEVARPGDDVGWRQFSSSQKVAWKTGTSYGFRDGWAIGINPRYTVGVWVGNGDGEGRPNLTGVGSAAPIMFELFGILEPVPWFEYPESELQEIDVCAQSGYRTGPYCIETRRVNVVPAGLESPRCPHCRLIHMDETMTSRVHGDCYRIADIKPVTWFMLPPVMEWFYKRKHSDYQMLPPYRPDCLESVPGGGSVSISLVRHQARSTLAVPVELDGSRGRTVFTATHRDPRTTIYWHLNENYLTSTREIHQIAVDPGPGTHTLTLVDEYGEHLEQVFTVVSQ